MIKRQENDKMYFILRKTVLINDRNMSCIRRPLYALCATIKLLRHLISAMVYKRSDLCENTFDSEWPPRLVQSGRIG